MWGKFSWESCGVWGQGIQRESALGGRGEMWKAEGIAGHGVFGGTKRVQIQEEKHPEEGSALGNPRRAVWHNVRHGRITVSPRGESCGASGL